MKVLCAALLTMSLPCLGSPTKNTSADLTCPVKITQAYFLGHSGIERTFYLSYLNQSAKVAVGAKFGFGLLDGVGDYHELNDLVTSRKTKVGKQSLNSTFAVYEPVTRGLRIYVKKVAFDDGSVWEDDGSYKCQWLDDRAKN